MKTDSDLRELLSQIDHKGYPSYKRCAGKWEFKNYILSIDHVQGDPFASPSNVSVIIDGKRAGFPTEYYDTEYKRRALEDYLLRMFSDKLSSVHLKNSGSGKSGAIYTSLPGQEILTRTAMSVEKATGSVTARFEVGFPARGRTVMVEPLERILYSILPKIVSECFFYRNLDDDRLANAINLAEDVYTLRKNVKASSMVAFVANGSILPRESGVSQRPMKGAVPFKSPETLEVEFDLPHSGKVIGMGIREGIFLIVGGGYHGKSTLLSALERGVYDHIAGDGREFVVTVDDAMKIRAEDGRCIKDVDVSLFINNLPNGKDTTHFSTDDASGSTSQAANVVEAMEMGSKVLLIDEDTCATNFMVRDELMRRVVKDEEESITPFLFRMRQMYEECGISTVLVAGSSGSFFEVADTVIQMDEYVPVDVTARAKQVIEESEEKMGNITSDFHEPEGCRCPLAMGAWKKPDARVKTRMLAVDGFSIDRETVDLRGISQLVDREQTMALALSLKALETKYFDGKSSLTDAVDLLYADIEKTGLEMLCGRTVSCGLALPRKQEMIAVVNRFRMLKLGR